MYHVVVIEDDNIIRRGIIAMLGRLHLPCEIIGEAADGVSGLELICGETPDIVITDIKMPLLNGVEMIQRAVEKGVRSKFLVISGFDDYQYVRNAMKNGAADYLLKPISRSLLEKSMKQIIDLMEQEKQKENYLVEMQNQLNAKTRDIQELKLEKLLEGDPGSEAEFDRIQIVISRDTAYSVAIIENNQENLIRDHYTYRQMLDTMKDEIYDFCIIHQMTPVITRYRNQIVMIANHGDWNEMEKLYEELLGELKKRGRNGSISISDLGTELDRLKDHYNQAYEASSYKIYADRRNKLLKYMDLRKEITTSVQIKGDINAKIYQIVNDLEICDKKSVMQMSDELLSMLYTHRTSSSQILEIMGSLFNTADKMVADLAGYHHEESVDPGLLEGVYNFNLYRKWCREQLENRLDFLQRVRRERNKKIVEQVRQYIHRHYMESITLTEVADYVNLSPNYLSEVFRKETGQTFIRYLINYRMQEAKNLLQNTDYKIYQIAEMVGYKEVISFNRAFKSTVGMTPKEYGNRLK